MFFLLFFSSSFEIVSGTVEIPDNKYANDLSVTGTLIIPNSVTRIGNNAFSGCTGLTGSLTIPQSVYTIGSNAFLSCTGLQGSIVIPISVNKVGEKAFSGCSDVKTIMYSGYDDKIFPSNAFLNNNKIGSVFVFNIYKKETFCGYNVNIIPIEGKKCLNDKVISSNMHNRLYNYLFFTI